MTQQLENLIAQMKEEILDDVRRGFVPGFVPRNCVSFGELHDYRDANCYGGLCDDEVFDALVEQFGGRDEDEGMPDGMLNLINAAQDAVDEWIKQGGLL